MREPTAGEKSDAKPVSVYTTDRFSVHDTVITKAVLDFNADKAAFISATVEQAKGMPDLAADLVKVHPRVRWR